MRLLQELRTRDHCVARRIGILLPLSGPYQAIGEEALRGIRLALPLTGITLRTFDQVGCNLPEQPGKGVFSPLSQVISRIALQAE